MKCTTGGIVAEGRAVTVAGTGEGVAGAMGDCVGLAAIGAVAGTGDVVGATVAEAVAGKVVGVLVDGSTPAGSASAVQADKLSARMAHKSLTAKAAIGDRFANGENPARAARGD